MSNETVAPPGNHVNVKVVQFSRSPKPSLLATAKVELTFGSHSIVVDEVRVLRNRNSQIWIAMPAHSVPGSGRAFEYAPSVVLSRSLFREVEDLVIVGYEKSVSMVSFLYNFETVK